MRCALWYWSHGSTGFWLYDDEAQAVRMAAADSDDYAIAGVQFEDGSYVERDEWTSLREYKKAQYKRWDEESRAARSGPQPIVNEVQPPFDGPPARTTEAVPSWLGRPR
jgi:hypothetical protein